MPNYNPDDILVAVLHLASFQKRERFAHNQTQWARFLYEHEQDFPGLRQSFRLRQGTIKVESADYSDMETNPLNQAYLNLTHCRLISGLGLTQEHIIEPGLAQSYEKFVSKRLKPEEIQKLEIIAQEFKEEFALTHSRKKS